MERRKDGRKEERQTDRNKETKKRSEHVLLEVPLVLFHRDMLLEADPRSHQFEC